MSFDQIARGIYGMRDGVMRGEPAAPTPRADAAASASQTGEFPTASPSAASTGWNSLVIGGRETAAADLARFLSRASGEVLRSLEDEASARHLVIRDLSDQRMELIEKRGREEIFLQDVEKHRNDPGYAEAVSAHRGKIAAFNEEITRINARMESARSAREPLSRLSDRLKRYVADLVGNMPRDPNEPPLLPSVDLPEFTLKRGEMLSDAVEAKRRRVRELIADRERARVAPITSDKAKALALADIEARAEAAKPDCLNLIEYGEPIDWAKRPLETIFSARAGVPGVIGKVPDSIGLMALMFKDRLVSVVNAEIDEMSNDAEAMTDDQRAEVISACGRDLYAVQLEEEAMIRKAAEQGLSITRREDADPRAVLALPSDFPEPRK